jgi:hypothetical protein
MKCMLCKSQRLLRFVDGFGDKRIFCKGCGRSFLENNFIEFNWQKNLHEFRVDSFHNPIQLRGARA